MIEDNRRRTERKSGNYGYMDERQQRVLYGKTGGNQVSPGEEGDSNRRAGRQA